MNLRGTILKILAGIILATTIIYLTLNSGNKIDIFIPENPVVNEPLKIDVEISKNLQSYTPDQLNIKFYNKYNKSESLQEDITAYDEGSYSIIVTPNYEGEYVVEVTVIDDEISLSEATTFTVEKAQE